MEEVQTIWMIIMTLFYFTDRNPTEQISTYTG